MTRDSRKVSHRETDWWNEEFPVNQECMYLNHAAVAPWPDRSRKAVIEFANENAGLGASHYPEWIPTENRLRENLGLLIDAPVDSIALVKNTSEALSFVAYGLNWKSGDVVVISDQEFPSNRIVWESLSNKGVTVKTVSVDGDDPEAELIAAIQQSPRLVSISAVQYGTGIAMDLRRIGEACRAHGVLFCVDAIQAVGTGPFSVTDTHADFAMADGHKWLLGPEGLGFFYVRPDVMEQLALSEFGWHMVEHLGDYSRKDWQPATTARRFECGSPNMLAAFAFAASTDLLLEVGLDVIQEKIASNIAYLRSGLEDIGADILTPAHAEGRSGIITFRFSNIDSEKLYRQLMGIGVVCASRGSGIRFAPHFHTTADVLDDALDAVARLTNRS